MTITQAKPALIRRVFNAVWFHLRHLLVRRYRVRYQHNAKHLVADILILLIVIALIIVNGYIFFVFTKWAVSLQVQVNIDGPTTVRSGLPVEYKVTVENTARRGSLTDVVLSLDIPSTFQVQNISESITENGQIILGDIMPRARRQITISGVWWGNHADRYQLSVRANYQQFSPVDETLQWSDERDSSSQITVNGSVVACVLSAPDNGVGGEYVWLTVQCHNDGAEAVDQVVLAAPSLVANGQLARSVPAATTAGTWSFDKLAAGQTSDTVRLFVQLQGATGTSATIPLELRGKHDETVWLLDQPTVNVNLVPSPVTVTLTSNDQAHFAPQPGEPQTIAVTIKNISKQSLIGVMPVIDFSASLFDRKTIFQPAGEWQGDWLVWPARTIPAGESAVVTVNATTPTTVAVSQQQIIAGILQSDSNNLATPTYGQWVISAEPFSSQLVLTALARYYTRDGEQIGLGPLPPMVGFPTRYRVFFEVASDRHSLQSVTVKGTLPRNVIWDADSCTSISSGFSFNADSRELMWRAGTVAADQSVAASFCLTLTPLTSQVGMFAPLINNIVATGKDSVTERQLEMSSNIITTALPFDSFTAGRGKITK